MQELNEAEMFRSVLNDMLDELKQLHTTTKEMNKAIIGQNQKIDGFDQRLENLQVMARWLERPYLFAFPLVAAAAAIVLAASIRRRHDGPPFYMGALVFAAAFGTFAISFWPYMIPFSITVDQAAAPHTSLAFMFWGEGLFVFPLMLIYTAITYRVFRGKVQSTSHH